MSIIFLLLLVTTILNLFLAFFIYFNNRKSQVNVSFGWITLNVALWALTNAIILNVATVQEAIFWSKVSYLSGAFIGSGFLYFSLVFPSPSLSALANVQIRKYHKFLIALSVPLIILVIFAPNFTVKTVVLEPWKIITGPGLYIFALYFLAMMSWGFFNLIRKFFLAQGRERTQFFYLFLGTIVSTIIGSTSNLILPLTGNYQFVFLGPLFTIILIGFVTYAIVSHELFGIKIILTSLSVILIALLLFLDTLIFTETFFLKIIKSAIFILFLVLGYTLIKSVIREIEQREKLEKLTLALEETNKRLQELDKAKSEFVSITSHQLRTPMTAIKGYLSLALEGTYGKIEEKVKGTVEKVYEVNERLIRLINDLLNVSRIESGRIELEPEPVSLEEIAKNIIDILKIEAEKKNLYLKLERPGEPLPKLMLDREKIREAIFNIIDNAIRYTKEGGITIKLKIRTLPSAKTLILAPLELKDKRLKIDEKTILIEVKDTGVGMDKEELERVFENYYQGRTASQYRTEGLGMGLYIAKKFIELHNGRIWAESEGKGKGSTFYIELPSA